MLVVILERSESYNVLLGGILLIPEVVTRSVSVEEDEGEVEIFYPTTRWVLRNFSGNVYASAD